MTPTRRTAIAALVVPAVAVAATFAAGTAGASGDSDRIRLEATIASFDFVDANAAGITPGDLFVQTDTLAVDGRGQGRDILRCTAAGDQEHPGICDGVLALEDGTITVAGRLPKFEPVDGLPFVMAVTGGTGTYAGATGTVDVVETTSGYTATAHVRR